MKETTRRQALKALALTGVAAAPKLAAIVILEGV
ncbi:MAG: twin-arginine translocation signal domain-containing protein [Zoogloeaceae bacterium]|jgi:hypothetical protein|nr:twin-arginine translocation signal domain-containing protein [Zoogloeaceae bacterium]